ncbi:TPA: elongation factor 4 [Patescibacteria group bacterium]|uniref:Elongation factor 4 n=1 Tax=Candidatus Gottesmanbacteria bacterium GW2011_GWA1_43_11 TaxID=1618436 RepID=A0A0G1CKM0_9BACT|nr:MAG: GTP-binding protein LepA [Candidatus Gottesmanbacteria bacterium GW2011_GWA1_43_11]HCS78115.1 elongation factor 4 [Patescibacteria group bacterium]
MSFDKTQDTQSHIRNFCIIAHIDHGKSTLADRLLEMTDTVAKRDMQAQLLDSNPIERERGITIKLAPVRMKYRSLDVGRWSLDHEATKDKRPMTNDFILNLIDTPGHVDFSYEVSRSLQACEGAILVVDATQGVQAQTLANLNLARKQNLRIIPIINKIDLPNAQLETVSAQLVDLGFTKEEIIPISAKTGLGVDKVLKRIIEVVPEPKGDLQKPLRALIFSSQYDTHKGVVVYVRVVDGNISDQKSENSEQKIKFMASGMETTPIEIGYFNPDMRPTQELHTGEVGYIATGLKEVALAKVGDTITLEDHNAPNSPSYLKRGLGGITSSFDVIPLPGYKEPKPMVFVGLFPIQSDEYSQVREALGKLRLSDSAFTYRPISSLALGNGFHCGFLGLLHAEVVQERLTREFNLSLFATAPSVEYLIELKVQNSPLSAAAASSPSYVKRGLGLPANRLGGKQVQAGGVTEDNDFISIQSASEYPDPSTIEETKEPMMQLIIFSPKQYVGAIMQIVQDKRGEYIDLEYIGVTEVIPDSDRESRRDPRRSLSRASTRDGDEPTDSSLVRFTYLMPLSEMIIDFFDQLKSVTQGYASLDYEFFDYQKVEVVKLDVLVNHEKVDAFSQLVVSSRAQYLGRRMVEKLAEVIPRKQFLIPIQAAIGGTIIARADVKPFRKDVTQKLYGGDRTRKDKLLDKQKKGKTRMKQVGSVEIPQEAFLKVFSRS